MGTRAYMTAEGRLAPNQEKAGKGFTQVDIPYGKQEQLDWINERLDAERARCLPEAGEPVARPIVAQVADVVTGKEKAHYHEDGKCHMCWRDADTARRAAEKLNQGDLGDALVFAITDDVTQPFILDRVEAALAEAREKLGATK